jgi:hypothetical protein
MRTGGKKTITTILMVLLCIATFSSFFGTRLLGKEADELGAVLTGVIYDQGVDTDGDGAYNYLEIGVEVNVTAAGYYNIQANGLTSDLGYINVWASPSTFLVIGVQVIDFRFEGVTIYISGLNPANINSIILYDANYVILGELHEIPLSRVYSYAEFDAPGAILTGVIYDKGVDNDGNGAFDFLDLGVEVDVTEAGEYNVQAYSLLKEDYRPIDVGDSQSVSLDAGIHVVHLNLDGAKIFSSGLSIAHVSSIYLYDKDYISLGELQEIPLSRTYLYTEFDAPRASLTGVIYDRGVDTDGDGFFNFLEIGVEISVAEAGEYNVQAYGLLARGYGNIGVVDSQSASLEIGTLVIYLRFDGTAIYSSGLDPNFVSSISLYSAELEPLGEISEIPLSRTYSYSEFGAAIPVSVGVKAGDWAKYNITGAWQSTDPSATEPSQIEAFREIAWVKFEVQSVSNTYITILQTYHYKNGTEQSAPPMSGDMATQFITVVIPGNLSGGDVIPGTAAPLNSTVSRSYAGANRAVNFLGGSGSSFGMNMTQSMYWDKATGMLCEMFMEISMPTGSYVTTTSTSLMMIETNLWKMATEISCSVSKNTITEGDSIVVSGSLSNTLSGKTVTLTYRRPDGSTLNRTVTTGSDGSYSDSYTPDATGSWNVAASWEGDSTHSGATSSLKSFTVTPKSFIETPLGMATVGGGIIVAIATIVLVLRKRKPKSGKN